MTRLTYNCGCSFDVGKDFEEYWTISGASLCDTHQAIYDESHKVRRDRFG